MQLIKKYWKRFFLFCFSGGILLLLFILFINYRVKRIADGKIFTDVQSIPENSVALVLGTSHYLVNGHPNEYFTTRIDAAAELYFAHRVRKILVSGDNSQANYNEPEEMKNELVKKGIPPEDIVLDYAGFRTFDSMVRAREIFGLNNFIVVSQQFHCERAIYIAHAKHIDVTAYAAKDPVYTSTKTSLREYPARVSAFLDCYILRTSPHFYGEKIRVFENDSL